MKWSRHSHSWNAVVSLPTGNTFSCRVIPEDSRVPLEAQGLDEIRTCIQWLVGHEFELRQRIADSMFEMWREGWFDEEIDSVSTPMEFAEAITLEGVNIYEDLLAEVHYRDGGLYGGHGIIATINRAGDFTDPPHIWG